MIMEPIYIARPLINGVNLAAYASAIGLQNVLEPYDMHVTLAYSSDPVDWRNPVFLPNQLTVVEDSKDRQISRFGDGTVVLEFDSRLFSQRWAQLIMAGASWDFPEYRAHVTLSYDDTTTDIETLQPYLSPLRFGPEYREALNLETT